MEECLAFVEWINEHVLHKLDISHDSAGVEADLLVVQG